MISRNAPCHVSLNVVVVVRVVACVSSIRSQERGDGRGELLGNRFGSGVRHDHAARGNHLRVRANIGDLIFAGLRVRYIGTQVLTCRGIGIVQLPVQRVDADRVRHQHGGRYIFLHVSDALGVPADDNARVGLTRCELQVRIRRELVPCDSEANEIGRDHPFIVIGMLLEVPLQHQLRHARALTVARDDKRAAIVAVFKEEVESGSNIVVRNAGNRVFDVSGLLPSLSLEFEASLTVVRHEHIGGFLEHACVCLVFDRRARHDIGVAELGQIRRAFLKA